MQNYEPAQRDVADLHLDQHNPRLPDAAFASEDDALEYLVKHGALDELVNSITSSGWIDYEPLIVLRGTNEVVEGNRRLAVLRLIRDPQLARDLSVKVPTEQHPDSQPETVNVWIVEDRRSARDFIGFKHINGPFKWDSYAKAKYAAEWLADSEELAAVAKRLGDTHRTVARLVNGYTVLRQAERLGFERDRIPGRFAFSHLYTALTRPAYRDFLGMVDDSQDLLPTDPIQPDHYDELSQLMVWLYGQDETPSVIRSQNPDLRRLAEVLSNKTAVAMLSSSPSLDAAHAVVEDRSEVFAEAIFALQSAANTAASLIGAYEGDNDDLEEIMRRVVRTVRSIYRGMEEANDDLDGNAERPRK